MVLSDEQMMVIIKGVGSICDELLGVTPVRAERPDLGAPALKIVEGPATGATPVAPPATTIPAAPPAGTPPAAAAPATGPAPIELDPEGVPWDERIHTVKKSKLKSGVWRLKPGVDPVRVAKVKTELTLAAQAAAPPAAVPPAAVPPAAVPPAAVPPGEPMSWSDLLNRIVAASKTPEEVLAACAACGVENIGKLQDTPLLIPNVATVLGV